jgi:hypothetical protein
VLGGSSSANERVGLRGALDLGPLARMITSTGPRE